MFRRLFLLTLFSFLLLPIRLSASEPARNTRVYIPNYEPGTTDIYHYVVTLLNLAMAQTESEYGPVQIIANPAATPQQRQFLNLRNGRTDIMWSVTTFEREQHHHVIRIPLTGGMFGYRVLLVSQDNPLFITEIALDQLKQLSAVQGSDWPDTDILKYHGFNVSTSVYNSAFKLLDKGMVDYFPRAVHEVFEELSTHRDLAIEVESHIALQYHNPMFFFVSEHRPELAERLEVGLQRLYENGDLQRLLTSQHFYIRARNLLKDRTVYPLSNPLLTEETREALSHYPSPLSNSL